MVIIGLESPPCLIGMDIMRPLRVRIDVTEGTATPAQPDPQTIHLNAAQAQPRRKKLLASPAPSPPSPPEAADSGAAPPAPQEGAPSPLPQQQGRLLAEARSVLPSETAPSTPPPPVVQLQPHLWHHRTPHIPTRLAALGCCKQPTFRLRQLAL